MHIREHLKPVATQTEPLSEPLKDKGSGQLSVAATCKTTTFLGVVLLSPVHCTYCYFHLDQINHLCFLNGQIGIPEV